MSLSFPPKFGCVVTADTEIHLPPSLVTPSHSLCSPTITLTEPLEVVMAVPAWLKRQWAAVMI